MISTLRASSLVAAASLLLVLSGCGTGSPGGPGSEPSADGSGSGSGTDSGSSTSGCLEDRVWALNTDDLAAQLAANMSSNGMTVTESTANGRQSIEFGSDGTASSTVDVTYTLSIDSGDGIVITVVQTHSGTPHGEWAYTSDPAVLTFSNWDNSGYSIQNSILVNGVAGDSPISLPEDTLGDSDMEIVCEGNTLSTHVAVSPFTQHWIAEG